MHYYQDISHFRAPYKNFAVAGLGANVWSRAVRTDPWDRTTFGFGAQDSQPLPGGMNEADADKLIYKTDDGLIRFRPEIAEAMRNAFAGYAAIFTNLPSDPTLPAVMIVPFSNEEIGLAQGNNDAAAILYQRSALKWVDDQVKAGRVVFASIAALSGAPGSNIVWAIDGSDKTRLGAIAGAADGLKRLAPVLADGRSAALSKASMSPVLVGVVAAGVAAGVLVYAHRRRRQRRALGK